MCSGTTHLSPAKTITTRFSGRFMDTSPKPGEANSRTPEQLMAEGWRPVSLDSLPDRGRIQFLCADGRVIDSKAGGVEIVGVPLWWREAIDD